MQEFQSAFPQVESGFVPLFGRPVTSGFSLVQMPDARPLADEPPQTPAPTPEELLRAAHKQAAAIVEAASTKVEEQVRQAAAEAREEQLCLFQTAASELMRQAREKVQEALQRLERDAAALVVQIARRVTAEHFQAQPEAIVPVVREALQALGESAHARVVVAPQHEEPLRQAYRDLAMLLGSESRLEITVSGDAEPFGCVVHGDHGSFDARLDSRLQAIEQMVQETGTQQAA